MDASTPKSGTVAVVDDDEAVRRAVSFALRAEGYGVKCYSSALDLLGAGGLDDIDCLIIDVKLPDVGGIELLQRVRRAGCAAPAIMITTHPDNRCRRDAQQAGAKIVEKPLMGDALSREIGALLARA